MGIFKMIWVKVTKKSSNHGRFESFMSFVDNVDNVDYFL